jgi:hypothetical protein
MEYEEFEKKVKELVDDFGAPENITTAIEDFLFESGNIHTIVGLAEEIKE